MQVGDSPAHRNSSGSGNYEGNGAISEVMGLALHTGLAPAFLYCTTTKNLLLSTSCIQGPLYTVSCIVQLLNTLHYFYIPLVSKAQPTGLDPLYCTMYDCSTSFITLLHSFLYYDCTNTSIQGPAYWI